jgi:6-phosphogluconolactonase
LYRNTIGEIQAFDIAFLGMGEDGHTASLFPGNQALHDEHSVVAVRQSPKPPDERVSMGISTLKKARCRIVLASGEDKQAVIAQVRAGDELPVNLIGDIEWFIDKDAAGK